MRSNSVCHFRALALALTVGTMLVPAPGKGLNDAITQRQHLMRSADLAARFAGQMTTGDRPFDARRAARAMRVINEIPGDFVKLFPSPAPGSRPSGAAPAIWQNMADFLSRAQKLQRASGDAMKAAGKGETAFREALTALSDTCRACHEDYRLTRK